MRLKREQLVLEQSLIPFNEVATTTRTPQTRLWLWILEYHLPRKAWTQLAYASFSALTVTTIFLAFDWVSQYHHVDTALLRLETDEEIWTYMIRKDDPDQYEDMKRSIIADIRTTMRWNRNNDNYFKIRFEPVDKRRRKFTRSYGRG